MTHAYSYDPLNRLTQIGASKNASSISNYAYTLGAAGNRTSVAELSGRTVAYAYDSLYRLTSETVSTDPNNHNGAISCTYDSVGNRKTLTSTLSPVGANAYSYDADDRLAADQYDGDGNTTLSGGVANAYDFENHLVTHGGATVAYDGDGNRVAETLGGVTTNYLVDTQNPTGYAQVVDELVSATVTRTYAYGLERISENQTISSTWTPSFYGYDGHDSVRQLSNSSGTVTDTYDYDAFGNLISSTGSTPNVYLFAGEAYDAALGLYYNRARYLNTTTGRFWSADTYQGDDRDPLSFHKYSFANGDPVNGSDPSGNDDLTELSFAVAISTVLLTMSCSQAPKFVNIVRLAYEEEENGVHIVLGAQTKGRTPAFPAYQWVQMVTTNAILPAAKKAGAQPGTPFIDPQPHEDDTPYFYTFRDLQAYHTSDQVCGGSPCDFSFEDTPKRYPKFYKDVTGPIYWRANLYFVGLSAAGSSTYTPLVEIDYGFTVAQNGNMSWDDIKIARLF